MLQLPEGQHLVTLWLDGTPLEHFAEIVSLIALVVWMTGLALLLGQVQMRQAARGAAVVVLCLMALLVLAQASQRLRAPAPPPLQTMDYLARQFPNRAPLAYRDDTGYRYELTGATLSPTHVRAGEPFTLTTTWRDGRAPAQVGLEQELPSGGYFAYLFRFARSISFGTPDLSVHTVLTDALPGPLLLKLMARDAAGHVLTPTDSTGRDLERTFLTGLEVMGAAELGERHASDDVIRTFPNGIILHALDWYYPTGHDICFRPTWGNAESLAGALQVSLVLRGSDGREIARADTQPQAGLAPTWSWPTGTPVRDSFCVPTTGSLRAGEPYTLLVRWYGLLDQQANGEVTLVGERSADLENAPNIPRPVITVHRYDAPPLQQHTDVSFTVPARPPTAPTAIRLLGYDLITTTRALSVTLYWSAVSTVTQDYKSFVHLAPLSTPEPVRQADRLTRDGMYPTGMWLPGEIVTDTIALDLNALPAAGYQLAVGWYDPETLVRLPAESQGIRVVDGRYVLTEINVGH
jgi:hypothetical protein